MNDNEMFAFIVCFLLSFIAVTLYKQSNKNNKQK